MNIRIEAILMQLDKDNNMHILHSIVSYAAEYFEECPMEFCVQHQGFDCIIFGGGPRVIWHVRSGWRVEKTHCSTRFIEHAQEKGLKI